MVDFGDLAGKAKQFVEKHEDQIDEGIDKAAGAAGKRFGHEDQIDKVAGKLKDATKDEHGRSGPGDGMGRAHRKD